MRCPECHKHVDSFWSWLGRVGSMLASSLWRGKPADMPGSCPHCQVRLESKGGERLYRFFAGSVAIAVPFAAFVLSLWWLPPENLPRLDRGLGLAMVLFPGLLLASVIFYGLLFLRWLTGRYRVDRPLTQAAETIRAAIISAPPRCLRRLRTEPAPGKWPGDLPVAWSLGCPCGSWEGAVVVEGGAEGDWREVRRLAFRCARCDAATEFLDTWADGNVAETEGSTVPGPDATPGEEPLRPFACPRCGTSRGKVVVALCYQEASAGSSEVENLFDYVRVYSQCSGCGERSLAAETET